MSDDIKEVETLAAIAREFDLDAVRVRVGEREIEVVRRSPAAAAAPPAQAAQPEAGASAPAPSPHAKTVVAPLVGVFYRAASPGDEAFVQVGDRVEVGDVLCTLEAMKIFNEITSDYSGTVTRIIPENGELVALGDELFWIEP